MHRRLGLEGGQQCGKREDARHRPDKVAMAGGRCTTPRRSPALRTAGPALPLAGYHHTDVERPLRLETDAMVPRSARSSHRMLTVVMAPTLPSRPIT